MIVSMCLCAAAKAQTVCTMQQLKNAAPTLAAMYDIALRHAHAWKPDAVPVQISTTALGSLQPDGSAASWHLIFYSESAKASLALDVMRGWLNCSTDSGNPGRIPDLKPQFVLDGAKLYAIAKDKGADLLAQGYGVMIGTAAAPGTRHATWNISYQRSGLDGGLLLLVDANTGAVEKAIR
jgi:hypothetical protein